MRAPAATRRLTLAGIAFALLGSGTAWAPGTIALDEVMDQLKGEPKLIAEIEAELKAQKIAADAVICVGSRFGGHWRELGGARSVPYECDIGKRKLEIDGTVKLFDEKGREIDMGDEKAPEIAFDYSQTGLSWSWK